MASINPSSSNTSKPGEFLDSLQRQTDAGIWDKVVMVLRPIASLKLTVFLLLLATFATWVVTLEQNHVDFWHVKKKNFASAAPANKSSLRQDPTESYSPKTAIPSTPASHSTSQEMAKPFT